MKYLAVFAVILVGLFVMMASPIIVKHAKAFFLDIAAAFKISNAADVPSGRFHQAGFVTLLRSYGGYAAGTVVELPASTEAALITSGGGVTSAGPATAGPFTTNQPQGAGAILAGQSSLVVTNPLITVQSIVYAVINQAAVDTTLLYIGRVVASNGFFTVYGNAAATANTGFDWAIVGVTGTSSNPN